MFSVLHKITSSIDAAKSNSQLLDVVLFMHTMSDIIISELGMI